MTFQQFLAALANHMPHASIYSRGITRPVEQAERKHQASWLRACAKQWEEDTGLARSIVEERQDPEPDGLGR